MSARQPEEPERAGKLRLIFWTAICVLAMVAGINHWLNSEPSYKGKTLTDCLENMSQTRDPGSASTTEQREAINAMGTRAIPHLLRHLNTPAESTNLLRNVLEKSADWIFQTSGKRIYLPQRENYSHEAFIAFTILGPRAGPAIPDFVRMLYDTNVNPGAELLAAIGPEAIPALTNVLAGTSQTARLAALSSLGEMGTNAAPALPVIAAFMKGTNQELSIEALNVMGGMDAAAGPFIPAIESMLLDARYSEAAAGTLACLGDLRPLAAALTNRAPAIQWAAWIGLCKYRPRHDGASARVVNWTAYNQSRQEARINGFHPGWLLIPLLATNLSDPDPVLRAMIAERLGEFGPRAWAAVPALANALADPDTAVRHAAADALKKIDVTLEEGGIIRGPRREKKIALEFTGHNFAEGATTILDELARHHAKASFFLTGDFLRNPAYTNLARRILSEGHYLGAHSDKHLLYCPWQGPKTNLLTPDQFSTDLGNNLLRILEIKRPLTNFSTQTALLASRPRYWLPAFEWYNQDIVDWSRKLGRGLVNYTPGTRSNADYTQDNDTNFVSSEAIFDSILKQEREDPDGLNGFLLLFHLGVGPGRTDKMSARFGELLDYLSTRGYQFVRIDELMEGK